MYILVTKWDGYWDKIKNRPDYPNNLIQPSNLHDGAKAVFLRLVEGRVQRGWLGTVHDIQPEVEKEKTYFKVSLDRELDSSEVRKYENYTSIGWFEESPAESVPPSALGVPMTLATRPLVNAIPPSQKIGFIKKARHHVFGTDFEARDDMTKSEAIAHFDKVWDKTIASAILAGDGISYEVTVGLIREANHHCCYRDQQHRRLTLTGAVFVAQLDTRKQPWRNTQLWAVPAKSYDTRNLFVTFKTQAERDRWEELAIRLGKEPKQLGLEVLTAFMAKRTE